MVLAIGAVENAKNSQSVHMVFPNSRPTNFSTSRRSNTSPPHVATRFFPYDDVHRIALASNGVGDKLSGEWGMPQQTVPFCDANPSSSQMSNPSTSVSFSIALQHALGRTPSTRPSREADLDKVRRCWADLFGSWPLELAASGYAEWWLRHVCCPSDTSTLFQVLLDKLAEEERRRKLRRSGHAEEAPIAATRKTLFVQAQQFQSCIRMLLTIYADPPRSLEALFVNPSYHHQLFFRVCRLGAHQQWDKKEEEDKSELGLLLSLAAAIALHIVGNRLAMRHDLMRFLGRVEQNWDSLLTDRPRSELVVERDRVESLLALALD